MIPKAITALFLIGPLVLIAVLDGGEAGVFGLLIGGGFLGAIMWTMWRESE